MARETVVPSGTHPRSPHADVDWVHVLRVLSGDTDAFAPLWSKYKRPLTLFFSSRVHCRQEAEDLTSDTLLAALESLPRFRSQQNTGGNEDHPACTFKTYLYSIARHKLSHRLRRVQTRKEVRLESIGDPFDGEDTRAWQDLPVLEDRSDGPLEQLMKTEGLEQACQALAAVPSTEQFKALVLHYLAGLDHKEVATVLTTRSETVNSRLQDGRKALRKSFQTVAGP
jgi:RNA polymerase sigma factor (sigma-70 family)